ncbi:MAG: alginate lyase family protein [Sulfuricurvum sp.]|uniref:LamG-like jellyroll fold domain-containing protein n=1 Tax=Sulfuricurvum sp. TaxID=2025608 RepID=UPI00261887C0|nr:LamG-like jellyroll fold domain-containing protein [Sulfuricurvum sp.]MDD2828318.1 alginate lyase family protein [Sulfuricurvum sp.]MDD4949727.1 alginate lyase family protein [Sulfuricurvum sp.]
MKNFYEGLTRREFLYIMGVLSLSACGGGGGDSGSATGAGTNGGGSTESLTMTTIRHPGLLHTEADFSRMAAKVSANAEPWISGWNKLDDHDYTSLNRVPNPLVTVVRGAGVTDANGNVVAQNFGTMVFDMESAYQIALYWKITGDTRYADLAVRFLNEWSSTMTTLTGNADRFIAAGLYGYQWVNAAEIMSTYSGWLSADKSHFKEWLLSIWYPLCHSFITDHNGSDITNYWASWDALTLCGIFAIGVFCERVDICNEALNYYTTTGRGNGASAHNVYVLHPGYLGQWQESGRDQGHSTLSISCIASFCEMAWNQGIDLYGYRNNRFLAGAEYVAKSNLTDSNGNFYTLPYSRYSNRQGTMNTVSDSGRPHLRPTWEIIYNHYVNRKGLSAPWVSTMVAKVRPEWRDTGGDEPSFGTLTMSRDPYVGDVAPSGLSAVLNEGKVLLSWWGSAYATSYSVKRASSANGPFATIANVTDPRTYTDAPSDGIWYYAITATTPRGETALSNIIRTVTPYEKKIHLSLKEGSGLVAVDSSGNGKNGTLNGATSWGSGRVSGSALAFDGTSGSLSLPSGIMADIGDFTISVWMNWAGGNSGNQRLFDFGSSDIAYLALLLNGSNKTMRVATTGTMWYGEHNINAPSAISTNTWVHVAVTLSGSIGTLYLNGVEVASNNAVTFEPYQMGETTQNWLGRAQYSNDPYFKGRMEDFRLYSGALSATEISSLSNN